MNIDLSQHPSPSIRYPLVPLPLPLAHQSMEAVTFSNRVLAGMFAKKARVPAAIHMGCCPKATPCGWQGRCLPGGWRYWVYSHSGIVPDKP